MRIQHNIMAMNAYRNYTNNTSALSKNLEKLSSGYKINRAGDDAAGLAISEKMRAQITGLSVAQKNAKDGISLVQTAEGALTEVHDMLNRMVELADQSANGTYENTTDRAQLQKEFQKLTEEIDRIADATNFNGIDLLNGDLGGLKIESTNGSVTAGNTPAVAAKYVFDFTSKAALTNGQTLTIAGKTITAKDDGSGDINSSTANDLDKQLDAIVTALSDGGSQALTGYTVEKQGSSIVITADTAGVDANAGAMGADASWNSSNVKPTVTPGADEVVGGAPTNNAAKVEIDFTGKTAFDLIGNTMEIGTDKYQFVKAGETAAAGYTAIELDEGDDAAAILTKITGVTTTTLGDYTVGTSGNKLTLTETVPTGTTEAIDVKFGGMGLKLQIGDTNDPYNRITVSINSIKKGDLTDLTEGTGLALEDLSIGTQGDASEAMKALKGMINYVSDIRGDLGATQNRLDHTINNLSVMEENIQDAESTIRDTDVADEMMAYTKNNILIQSAQAMLAQANQVPQGVLQLLQ